MIEDTEPNAMHALETASPQNQQAINPWDAQREKEVFVTVGQLRHCAEGNKMGKYGHANVLVKLG
jgi:hypothetical protein